jgi:hypothetical protein
VGDPCPADEATDGDDRVGEVEERVDHLLAALVAALQPVERVVPGVGPLDVPTSAGLDRCLLALVCDLPAQPAISESLASLARVVAGVEMDGDLVGQRAEIAQQVQGRSQQRRVVALCPDQDPAQRDALALDQHRPFHALFAPVHRGWAGDLAPAGCFGDAPVNGDVVQQQAEDRPLPVPPGYGLGTAWVLVSPDTAGAVTRLHLDGLPLHLDGFPLSEGKRTGSGTSRLRAMGRRS